MLRVLLSILLLALAAPLHGQPQSTGKTAREIDALIDFVRTSGCEMERNGARHDAAAAADHLRMKRERAGARVGSAEQFIDALASRSSVSGRPYRIYCPSRAVQASGDWLRAELQRLRAGAR
jgi:hypothetical protein